MGTIWFENASSAIVRTLSTRVMTEIREVKSQAKHAKNPLRSFYFFVNVFMLTYYSIKIQGFERLEQI